MKSTYKSLKYNQLHFGENYRSGFEFPSREELIALGKSIEENGFDILEPLGVEPMFDDKGNRIPDAYGTLSGAVRLAAIGTLPPQKLNEVLIPCRIWTGLSADERTKLMFLANEHKTISLWSQATVLERYRKNGHKDKNIALSMNKSAQLISIMGTLLAYPIDIREEGQKGRFSPTLAWQLLSAKGAKKNPEPVFAKVREVLAKVPTDQKVTAKDFEIAEELSETIEVSKESFDTIKANAEKSVILEAELARVKAESAYASAYKELETLVSKLPATETAELKSILVKAGNDSGARTTEAYVSATKPITEGIEFAKLAIAEKSKNGTDTANQEQLAAQNAAQNAGAQAIANLPTGEPTGDTAGHIKVVTEVVGDTGAVNAGSVQTPSAPSAPVQGTPVNQGTPAEPAKLPPTEAPDKHQSEIERLKAHIGTQMQKLTDCLAGMTLTINTNGPADSTKFERLSNSIKFMTNAIARLRREESL